jgi:hypothetical protein
VLALRRSEKMPIRRNRSLPAAGERIETRRPARVTTLEQPALGGHGSQQATYAAQALCKCTPASQGTAGYTASKAW